MRLALTSCANYPFGFFNVYARVAARADLDAVLHLGDYFYEYANNNYGNRPGVGDGTAIGRIPSPNHEAIVLDDYRGRYAQYREDPDLQAAHRQHPWIAVWDDHETANNSWSGGAENHNTGEGAWAVRRAAGAQAWREWMPVREDARGQARMYRQFSLGDLRSLCSTSRTRISGAGWGHRASSARLVNSSASARRTGCSRPSRLRRAPSWCNPRPAGDVRAKRLSVSPPAAPTPGTAGARADVVSPPRAPAPARAGLHGDPRSGMTCPRPVPSAADPQTGKSATAPRSLRRPSSPSGFNAERLAPFAPPGRIPSLEAQHRATRCRVLTRAAAGRLVVRDCSSAAAETRAKSSASDAARRTAVADAIGGGDARPAP